MELSLKTAESFDEVMRFYTPMVYRIAFTRLGNPSDCEDVTQDVFLRYFKANITFESEEHRKAWLIRCAVNRANSYAASAWYRHKSSSEDWESLAENEILSDSRKSSVEENSERSERRFLVLQAVMKLPPKYRTAIYLFYFEDLPTAKIAEITKARESTVRSQLSRAREMLKKLLGEVDLQ